MESGTHNDVDLAVGSTELHQQIVQQVKLLEIVALLVAGAVIAEKMIQLGDSLRNIVIADAIHNVKAFARMQMVYVLSRKKPGGDSGE